MSSDEFFDTSKDFRILIAEKAIYELEKLFQAVKLQKRREYLKELKELSSDIQIIKYSYVTPKDIKNHDNFKKIVKKASEMLEVTRGLERDRITIQINYWLEYLARLPEMMDRGVISKIYEAIRFFGGEIVNRREIDNLWLCSVDCSFRMDVITNSKEYKQGKNVVVAYLPPRIFGKHISEGMFTPATVEKKGELSIDEIRKLGPFNEVEAILLDFLK